MVFIETPTFTRLIAKLLDDYEYSRLQEELGKRPDAGDLIKGGGGFANFGGSGQEPARGAAYG